MDVKSIALAASLLILSACDGGGGSDQPATKPGNLQFSSATYSVAENGASVTIAVIRSDGSAGTVTAEYSTSDGTAIAGRDYTAVFGTLAFVDGVTSQSFTIPILDDTMYEGNEMVNVTLSNVTGGASMGTPSSAVVTIIDDDAVSASVSWSTNRELSVNSPGGGYRVYYSTTPGFDISTANIVDVPYVSGPTAPTSIVILLSSGTYYFKVVGYSILNSAGSEPSQESSIVIP